ncbi:MAG TPA: G/U mismatch-specific DNA glycosylase [Rhodocyclaceae bacterium]|nr:G/U mismatch-specific DNA glycosylase [Rhodocyclaceae bacterium]
MDEVVESTHPGSLGQRPQALLPDVLADGLSVVFCGINPGVVAAASGHHFQGRGNRFWRVLHMAGFTPELMRPESDRELLAYGYGLTTAVSRPTARADQLSLAEIRASSSGLIDKIKVHQPRYVAFLGKAAYAAISDQRQIVWGCQPATLSGSKVWVLPNTSGLNRSFSLEKLVESYKKLCLTVRSEREIAP